MALIFGSLLEKNQQIHDILDATSIIAVISETGHVKFSSKMLSIMSTFPSSKPVFDLQLFPFFFNDRYYCLQPHSADINVLFFHCCIYDDGLEARSLAFEVDQEDRARLTLEGVNDTKKHEFQLSPWDGRISVSQNFDLGTFVSIDSEQFRKIVLALCYEHTDVIVTLRKSHVEFYQSNETISITPEERQCIIGGVPANYVLQFRLSLFPRSFYTLAPPFKRIWIFRSESNFMYTGLVNAPIGMYARLLVYMPLEK